LYLQPSSVTCYRFVVKKTFFASDLKGLFLTVRVKRRRRSCVAGQDVFLANQRTLAQASIAVGTTQRWLQVVLAKGRYSFSYPKKLHIIIIIIDGRKLCRFLDGGGGTLLNIPKDSQWSLPFEAPCSSAFYANIFVL